MLQGPCEGVFQTASTSFSQERETLTPVMKMINRTDSHQINRPVKWSEINIYVPILKRWEMELIKKRWTSLTALSVSILLCRNTRNTVSWLEKPSGFEPDNHSKGQNNTTRGKRCFWSYMTFILQRKWKVGTFFTKKKKNLTHLSAATQQPCRLPLRRSHSVWVDRSHTHQTACRELCQASKDGTDWA